MAPPFADLHMEEREVGFIELLRVNKTFRRYWFGNSISMLGEWFNTVALFVLIERITGSALAIGALFVLRMFALALPQVFTGMLADTYSRKGLMILANIGSALIILPLFLVDGAEDLWLIYAVSVGLMVLHAVYIPAENASIPNIVSSDQLLTANALNSATWSAALALGSALGGFVVSAWGVEAAFIIDAASFILAALVISTLAIPQAEAKQRSTSWYKHGLSEISEGWRIILATPPVRRIITAKALWGLFGGGLVYMLVLIGAQGGFGDVAAGIGILFAARGVGTGIGPLLARYIFLNRSHWPYLLGWLVSTCGLSYVLIALVEWGPIITILIIIGHAASGVNWVLSTVMLQERSEDEWRGRMFATDFLLMTTVNGCSTMLASLILEYGDWSLRQVVLLFAILQVISGIVWTALVVPGERRENRESKSTPVVTSNAG